MSFTLKISIQFLSLTTEFYAYTPFWNTTFLHYYPYLQSSVKERQGNIGRFLLLMEVIVCKCHS